MAKHPLIIAAALGAAAVPAQAGFISLNSPFDGGPTFTPLPGDQVEVRSTFWGGLVAGYQPAAPGNVGQASFGLLDFTGQLTSNYTFIGSATESLIFHSQGNPTAIKAMTATITWASAFLIDDGSVTSITPKLAGTGVVLTSSGDDPFEADFSVGATFTITADFLASCSRFGGNVCVPNVNVNGELLNGTLTPTVAVPSPPIGQGWLNGLLTLALMTVSTVIAMNKAKAIKNIPM
jgi:hypothetical protein